MKHNPGIKDPAKNGRIQSIFFVVVNAGAHHCEEGGQGGFISSIAHACRLGLFQRGEFFERDGLDKVKSLCTAAGVEYAVVSCKECGDGMAPLSLIYEKARPSKWQLCRGNSIPHFLYANPWEVPCPATLICCVNLTHPITPHSRYHVNPSSTHAITHPDRHITNTVAISQHSVSTVYTAPLHRPPWVRLGVFTTSLDHRMYHSSPCQHFALCINRIDMSAGIFQPVNAYSGESAIEHCKDYPWCFKVQIIWGCIDT